MTTREELITGFRQLADFLSVNPDVPVPDMTVSIQITADGGSDDERRAFVDRAASAMGVEPFDPYGRGEHWEAVLRFGPVKYYVLAIDQRHMADYEETQRLGKEALAAKKAAEARPEYDSAVVPAGWCCAESYAKQDACDECKAGTEAIPGLGSTYEDPAVRAAIRAVTS